MIIGVTGSERGMTDKQFDWLRDNLIDLGATELHHGDCVGVDSVAHDLASELRLRVVVHPPTIPDKRAYCVGPNVLHLPTKPYLIRNHDIVDACGTLLALPDGPERLRSGTWATVRYARRVGRPVLIRLP